MFDNNYFGAWSVSGNTKAGNAYLYTSSTDSLATVAGSGYFNNLTGLAIGDIIYVVASDGSRLIHVTAISPNVTTATVVTAGQAASIRFVGTHTTVGTAAFEDITVTGMLATDLAFVTLETQGATPRVLLTAKADTDKITITFDGDPSTDHVLSYLGIRII